MTEKDCIEAGIFPLKSTDQLATFVAHDSPRVACTTGFLQVQHTRNDVLLRNIVALAALFHDFGKYTKWFQKKLRKSKNISDLLRHEIISYAVLRATRSRYDNDRDWLLALSDQQKLPILIEEAFAEVFADPYRFLSRHEKEKVDLGAVLKSDMQVWLSGPLNETNVVSRAVANLVLTHHRLANGYPDKEKAYRSIALGLKGPAGYINHDPTEDLAVILKETLALPNTRPIWRSDRLLRDISRVSSTLATLPVTDAENVLKACALYGRTALILGDHKASEDGRTRNAYSPATSKLVAFANTSTSVAGYLGEPLDSHLRSTMRESRGSVNVMLGARSSFPALFDHAIPACIGSPTPGENGRFRWQVEVGEAIKTSRNRSSDAGFFGVLMAETGSGKTRAAPILFNALRTGSGDGMRLTVTSGLRALTLQAGQEYRDDLGFNSADVNVVIGDTLTRQLSELESEDRSGSSASELDDYIVDAPTDPALVHQLPAKVHRLFSGQKNSDKRALLAAPVLVCTLDTVMPVADAKRGGHTIAALRLASSDLFIDEIDDFQDEDIAAICRLVHHSAAFGRKVVVASATVRPDVIKALALAYLSGRKIFDSIFAGQRPSLFGFFSNATGPALVETGDVAEVMAVHTSFVGAFVAAIDHRPAKRRMGIARFHRGTGVKNMFLSLDDHINVLHDKHHVCDPVTGKRVSIGVVRWSNLGPSIKYAQHLAACSRKSEGRTIKIVPYNGSLFPAVRHRVEQVINPLLKRRLKDGVDPIFDKPVIRTLLDGATENDVIVVVVTTSLEETGRDHDFDWALAEPSSLRGVIQLAGRCRRHREAGSLLYPNLLIMEATFRQVCALEGGERQGNYLSFPGVETPVFSPSLSHVAVRGSAISLKDHGISIGKYDVETLYDVGLLSECIDARSLISDGHSSGTLGAAERRKTVCFLADGFSPKEFLTVADYVSDPNHLWSRYHVDARKFRRSSENRYFYLDLSDKSEKWWEMNENGSRVSANSRVIAMEIAETALLIPIGPLCELQADLVSSLGLGAEDPMCHSLLAVRPLRRESETGNFFFHPALGFFEERKSFISR